MWTKHAPRNTVLKTGAITLISMVILAILACQCVIISNGFVIKPANLQQIYILGFSGLVLKIGVNNLDFEAHLAISTQNSKKMRSTSLLFTNLGRPLVLHFPGCPFKQFYRWLVSISKYFNIAHLIFIFRVSTLVFIETHIDKTNIMGYII